MPQDQEKGYGKCQIVDLPKPPHRWHSAESLYFDDISMTFWDSVNSLCFCH